MTIEQTTIEEIIMDPRTLDWVEIVHPIAEITDKHIVLHRFSGMAHGFGGNPSYAIGKRTVKRFDRAALERGETIKRGRSLFSLSDKVAQYVGEHPENSQ